MDKKLSYFATGFSATNIGVELSTLRNDCNKEPNKTLLEIASEMLGGMQHTFKRFTIDSYNKWGFYNKLFFGDQSVSKGTKNLIGKEVDFSKRTVNKLLNGKIPSREEFDNSIELFDDVYERALSLAYHENLGFRTYGLAA